MPARGVKRPVAPVPPSPVSETALYAPVKRFLEARGYDVKGEVRGCDVVGVGPDGVAVVELKLALTLGLVLQGVDRLAVADEVWLAVPTSARRRARDARTVRLCRLLGFGLLLVGSGGVEVLAEPGPYRPRQRRARRDGVLREHRERSGDPMPGGSTRLPVMTAYRQRALACAVLLRGGPGSVRYLAEEVPGAGRIVLRNVYGWFERERRGVYRLTDAGARAAAAATTPAAD